MSPERRAKVMSWVWWALLPGVCGTYWVLSDEAKEEKAMLVFLAGVAIIGNAVSYDAKAAAHRTDSSSPSD